MYKKLMIGSATIGLSSVVVIEKVFPLIEAL
jgi:hypothetical protein